jgi:hypothetical protein
MYLIKCSKCNNLIEVKTEFLMICPKCKARLENSFQMWHQQKENRDKNFTNYLDEVCVSSEQIEERQRQECLEQQYSPKKNKRRKVVNIAVAVLALAAAIVVTCLNTDLMSIWWLPILALVINSVIMLGTGVWSVLLTLRRKRFQSFLPVFISLGALSLTVAVNALLLIVTDNT